ncbi:hypothetical protein O181_037149 [Austropuccinia psidii MF-1]|uniref:Uncharacterized protein n=1 Tax=Austropuccinia psidii MF-1 TaxID=1389203 RepID=A0A9Q3D5V9_9BASI|nr:hypothetical protein [Austropuccinia psidii MF-1]
MEDIITRRIIYKSCARSPVEFKIVPKTSKADRRPERPVLKCNKCGSTPPLAKTYIWNTKINGVQIIEGVECAEESEEYYQYSASDDTPTEDYPIGNMIAFFEVTKVRTHFPQYSEDCYNLINIQEARMFKTKTPRGK